jgi:hypothetical protein
MGTACVIPSGEKSQLSHEAQLSQPRAGTVNRTQLVEEEQASIRRVRVWLGLTDRANSYSCLFMYRGLHSQLRGGQFANSNSCGIHESTVQHSEPRSCPEYSTKNLRQQPC